MILRIDYIYPPNIDIPLQRIHRQIDKYTQTQSNQYKAINVQFTM